MSNGLWEQKLTEHSADIKEIKQTTSDIQITLTEIKLAFAGSEKIGLKGFAQRVEDAECYIDKDKKQKYMIRGGVIVLGLLWGAIKLFFNKIFT